MTRALALSTAAILAGAGLAGGLFWAFVNTPESTVLTLAVSLLLIVALLAVLAVTFSASLAAWAGGWRTIPRDAVVRGVLAFVPALLVVLAGWFVVGGAIDRLTLRNGEVSAWFLATFDWQDVRPLIRAAVIFGEWLRWIAIPFAALLGLGRAIAGAWRPASIYAWQPRASAAVRLLLVTAVAAVTLWAPVTYGLYWMPRGLPPTWIEPAVAAVKLATIALVGAVGLSVIVGLAARRPSAE
jgi:hypothetical protein